MREGRSGVRTGSLESLRELNRLRVVETLRERGTASRAEIARVTGLSRSTVSSLVADLQGNGLVVEYSDPDAPASMATGRPPTLLSLDRSAGAVVGIDFGHDRIHAAVSDLSRTVLAEAIRPEDVDHDAEGSLDTAAELVNELLAETGLGHGDVIGVGMALSGPIDHDRGAVRPTAILPGWEGLAVAAEMSRRLGDLPVHLDNDANLGALAEVTLGAARDARNALYVMISSGIGAGLIIDGRPYRGGGGMAGEIGHVLVDETGPICRCGNRGCLETYISGPALTDLLRRSRGEALGVDDIVRLAQGRRRRLPARDRRRRAACSAARWPRSAMCSTPTRSWWAETWARRATSCSTRCERPWAGTRLRRPRRTHGSWQGSWGSARRCSARSLWPFCSPSISRRVWRRTRCQSNEEDDREVEVQSAGALCGRRSPCSARGRMR